MFSDGMFSNGMFSDGTFRLRCLVMGCFVIGRLVMRRFEEGPIIFFFILVFFLVAVRPFCAPCACLYIISSAGVVTGTPHPAV